MQVCMQASNGMHVKVTPHLIASPQGGIPHYTGHSLKQVKIDLYSALLLHTDYIVEASAHAGSELERLSMRGAIAHVRAMRPAGLAVALHYARGARSQSITEIDRLAYSTIRAWIAEVGLANLPRVNGWAALTAWVNTRLCVTRASDMNVSLRPMIAGKIEEVESRETYE